MTLPEASSGPPLRVTLVIPTLDRGGAEKQLCLLASGLGEWGVVPSVVVLTRDGPMRSELDRFGIPTRVIGKRGKLDPLAYRRLKRELAGIGPDVVHTWLFAANAYGRAAALSVGVPVILGSERCVDLWKGEAYFAIDRYLERRTAGLTTNSVGVRDFYVGHGIAADRIAVIPNGVPPRLPGGVPRGEALARLGLSADRRLILAVGRLWPQKRYRDMIWAGEMLATLDERVVLVIVGDGPQIGELLRHRDAISRPDHVRFVGHRDDVLELLPHAEVFWNASEYEGQSNALIEAMQAGVPVVASSIAGNRDLVTDGETGLLFESGSSADLARQTRRLFEDRALGERLGAAGRAKIASQFRVDAMVGTHARLYRALVDQSRRGAAVSIAGIGVS